MLIKKYLQFISESNIEDFNSFGEWLESLSDDEYILNIVNRYIDDHNKLYGGQDINPTIDLVNAVNLLDDRVKNEIKSQIDKYLEIGIEEKKPTLISSTDTSELLGESIEVQSEVSMAGKGIFNSFLKSLTALGLKESNPNWALCPEDFLLYYSFENLNVDAVRQIFA